MRQCSLVGLDPVEVFGISPEEIERVVGRHGGTELAVHRRDSQRMNDVGIVVNAIVSNAVRCCARVEA